MATEKSNEQHCHRSNSSEVNGFLQDLQDRYRYLHELEKQLNAIPARMEDAPEGQMLAKEFARVFADAMTRELFIEEIRRNGQQNLPGRRPLGTA